ncbi:DUF3175 domain-containing protein [Candidatus Saccharibacteria bacterium]|nr:DUF3175 domain-containing protein [Candidatus Saccharibacteria bacterium]
MKWMPNLIPKTSQSKTFTGESIESMIFGSRCSAKVLISKKLWTGLVLNFYINRAGKNLSASRKETLQQAKIELRRVFGKEK